jgi:hypothetical protein
MNLFFPGFWNITLTTFAASAIKGPAPFNVWAGLTLSSNGIMSKDEGGNATLNYPGLGGDNVVTNMPPRWLGLNASYFIGTNEWEGMLEVVSGGAPNISSDAINTWFVGLNPGRTWHRQINFAAPGTDNSVWRVSIRRRPTGAIVWTGDFNINLQCT